LKSQLNRARAALLRRISVPSWPNSRPAGTNETQAIGDFMAWLLGASDASLAAYNNTINNRSKPGRDPDVNAIRTNNGLHGLHANFAKALLSEYIVPSNVTSPIHGTPTAIAHPGASPLDGCTNATTGANPGAL
jgi:hypothetical protein